LGLFFPGIGVFGPETQKIGFVWRNRAVVRADVDPWIARGWAGRGLAKRLVVAWCWGMSAASSVGSLSIH
jgi:hypothetical protein